ncbi:hypothetical protein Daes_0588 [Pseudodesulfovibrio aespoeensis Aspo-2]|uniref:Uncharacterized protein n=1 Tax=Pseudodesulfovibrio aespoeensis (strain ATCC 700646 / DSM 10631 / Aspo-2) TaxID=643562 RepID=E6VYU4_PSEA9|nr:hypothetical protein Daes_0588 [Pseudodesulfovibrio aespoeensis Aspo-2]
MIYAHTLDSGRFPEIRHQARKKDSKYLFETLNSLVVELEGTEPMTS